MRPLRRRRASWPDAQELVQTNRTPLGARAALDGDVDGAIALGCQSWCQALGLSQGWIALVDEVTQSLSVAASVGISAPPEVAGGYPLLAAAVSTLALWKGEAMLAREPGEWATLANGPLIVAPLLGPEVQLGVIVGVPATAEVTPSHLALATEVASRIALGILAARKVADVVDVLGARIRELEAQVQAGQRHRRLADEASELLRRGSARLHAIIDRIPQGLVIVRAPDGVLALANPVATGILGLDRDGRATRPVLTAAGLPYPPEQSPLARALRGEICSGEEIQVEVGPGRRTALLVSAAPLLGTDGQVEEAVLVFQDITPLKEVDRLKSEIISLVSHELRTPLHHIKGFTSTLLTPELVLDEATRQDLLESIDAETVRLIHMVTDLLDLARLEAGAAERAEKTAVSPSVLLPGAIRRFQTVANSPEVVLRVAEDLPPVAVDRARIERVLINLLGNAVKFSQAGQSIDVEATPGESDLLVKVIDHGSGVRPDERERIFERFFRGAGARGGTGLGLNICKSIVEAHGGSIWVEDTPGGGATFAFTLPWATGEAA